MTEGGGGEVVHEFKRKLPLLDCTFVQRIFKTNSAVFRCEPGPVQVTVTENRLRCGVALSCTWTDYSCCFVNCGTLHGKGRNAGLLK
jgi:hypothetical protein